MEKEIKGKQGQPLMKFEDMSPQGQAQLRIYSIIEKLLGKVKEMDANEAVAFVEARQWLTGQAQVLARRERALFDAQAKKAPAAPVEVPLEVVEAPKAEEAEEKKE